MIDEILKLHDEYKDVNKTAAVLLSGARTNKQILLFLIKLGLSRIIRRQRAKVRREIHATILNPQFVKGSATIKQTKLSAGAIKKLQNYAQELYTAYRIGGYALGEFTKEMLLNEAHKERMSGKGHIRNALWMEKLAEPMHDGQLVPEYWKSPHTVALIRAELWEKTEREIVTLGGTAELRP